MSQISTINFVNDLGYGSIKGILDGHNIHIPSVAGSENIEEQNDYAHFNTKAEESNYMKTLLDNLDVSIKSPTVSTQQRYLLGKNAVTAGLPLRTFDVASYRGKSSDDFSFILTLGIVAGYALQKYYKGHRKLPFEQGITANINMTTALPISEGTKGGNFERTRIYLKHYILSDHTVNIYNFGHPIKVTLHFNSTKTFVMLEGQAAHYAVKYSDKFCPGLVKAMRADFIHHYPNLAKGSKIGEIDNILTLTNTRATTVGVDIGEGTTDFDVFSPDAEKGNIINTHVSSSIQDGYGDVLDQALALLHRHGHNIPSRMQLKRTLVSKDPLDRIYKKPIINAINKYKPVLVDEITNALSQILRTASATRVIYVYGGGSIPMRTLLRKKLEEKTKDYTDGIGIIIIFIDPKYAQSMNKLGLSLILNSLNGNRN